MVSKAVEFEVYLRNRLEFVIVKKKMKRLFGKVHKVREMEL